MRISEIRLENWKNFRLADVSLHRRMFVIGPNASGKSNFLDAIRFLREISDPEGGLQRAVKSRGGVSEIRCLHARKYSKVAVEVKLEIDQDQWGYRIEFGQDSQRRAELAKEVVIKNGKRILERPNEEDEGDPSRLSQTFLEQIAKTPEKTLRSRLKKINCALQVAVPQLEQLELKRDDRGIPHLHGLYKHWRPNAGWQSEEHFSDGTLRLLGLLWGFLDGSAPLLLEEPELSLHSAVVQHIPAMMVAVSRRSGRQVFITTHSYELLNDPGIAPEETLRLIPGDNGTEVSLASTDPQVRAMAMAGLSMADAALPRTAPPDMEQLTLTLR